MSLFTAIKDAAISSFQHVKTVISGIFTSDIEPAITTFLHVLESNGGATLLSLALQTVSGALGGGVKFGALIASLIANAEAAGLKVTEDAAKAALTVAQTHLNAQVTPAAVIPPPAA